jgi:probable HAF family extracellular repeat protein
MSLHKFLIALALLMVLFNPLSGQAAPLYSVSFLHDVDFAPTGMNNAGQIVGFAGTGDGAIHAVLYAGGVLADLGGMGGTDSYATALNEAGAIVGVTLRASGEQHAFLYQDGAVRDLGAGTAARGINTRGDVVGTLDTASGSSGFLYRAGILTALANPGTGRDGTAVGINDHGTVAGDATSGADAASRRPFLYQHGQMSELDMPNGHSIVGVSAINNAGQIAGYSTGPDGAMHALLYQHGAMQDLGGLGDAHLDIHDLNEHGTLVGTASNEDDGLIPFMSLNGALVDLNTLLDPLLGLHIFSAYANNDLGQIVGYGCRDSACGLVRLDLAGAVPEPGGAFLWLAGLTMLARARQRLQDKRAPAHAMQWRSA